MKISKHGSKPKRNATRSGTFDSGNGSGGVNVNGKPLTNTDRSSGETQKRHHRTGTNRRGGTVR